jgi:hypothetical protein
VDPEVLFGELELHHRSLWSRVFDSRGHQLPLPCIDFDTKFLSDCQSFILQQPVHQREAAEKSVKNSGVLFKAIASLTIAIPFKSLQTTASAAFFCQFQMLVLKGLTLSGHLFQKQEVQLNVH